MARRDTLMLYATPLEPGESYATVARIRDVADLPEMPVLVEQWTEDGKSCKILLRALSYAERRDIARKAKDDNEQLVLLTCVYGIKEPHFTETQLDVLERKHPGAIDAIAETITKLGSLDATTVINYISSLTSVETALQ